MAWMAASKGVCSSLPEKTKQLVRSELTLLLTNVGGTTKEFDPIQSDKILLFGPGVEDTYECGNKLPIADMEDTGFSLHLIQMYEFYMQCISYSEFMAFMTALTPH